MPVTISGNGVFGGLTSVETVNVLHPDSEDVNIVLADDGSVTLDSIPASIQSAIPAGIGSNVVFAEGGDIFTTASPTSVNDTNLTVSITPSSNTSKVLFIFSARVDGDGGTQRRTIRARRTIGGVTTAFGKEASSDGVDELTLPLVALDSPGTTSTLEYGIQVKTVSGTARVLGHRNLVVIEVKA